MKRTGADVFTASLPPRRTRSAPKRDSCQILDGSEECKPQSLYSGVLEFMCVIGKGDFSMTIENAFRQGKADRGVERKGSG